MTIIKTITLIDNLNWTLSVRLVSLLLLLNFLHLLSPSISIFTLTLILIYITFTLIDDLNWTLSVRLATLFPTTAAFFTLPCSRWSLFSCWWMSSNHNVDHIWMIRINLLKITHHQKYLWSQQFLVFWQTS